MVKHNYVSSSGYVPGAATVVKIAEAIWAPIYGEEIEDEKPFTATLNNDVWTKGSKPFNMLGGVAEIEISKKDSRILGVSHGK